MYYDMWKNPEKYSKANNVLEAHSQELYVDRNSRRGGTGRKLVGWENETVAALEDVAAVANYLNKRHEITASEAFQKISLERQKAFLAGIEFVKKKYGSELDVSYVDALGKNERDQGQYSATRIKIYLHPTRGDGFVIGVHEAVHARDAALSEKMDGFDKMPVKTAYNMYSAKILAEAKKELGLSSNQTDYSNLLMRIFGLNTTLYEKYKDNPGEIIAYAIDYEATGHSNELSAFIAERFGND